MNPADPPDPAEPDNRSPWSTPLMPEIRQAIRQAGGALPFVRFMELALGHPRAGYYASGPLRTGREGDFVTAPALAPLFGECIVAQVLEIWRRCGEPSPFTVVEAGGGDGRLAAALWRIARALPALAPFAVALRGVGVETSPAHRERQRQTLWAAGADAERLAWVDTLEEACPPEGLTGVILGHEFLDALPLHWVERGESGLMELAVVESPGGPEGEPGLDVVPMPPQPPLSSDYFSALGLDLPPGMRAEVGLAAQDWTARAARLLTRGALLFIDYGHPARDLYHPAFFHGTLTGYRQHRKVENPLLFPGAMDLTGHVDFSAIARAAVGEGAAVAGFTPQAWFLLDCGLLERLERQSARLSPEDQALARQAVMRLVLPQGMGERFKALLLTKGFPPGAADEGPFMGFRSRDLRGRL
ncbi:MAG: SAM-dependent methyltransferase [Magnetococcales bacterium]|nr:SAM-dependent methyltransferase [Magnetococcales bacterium]